MSSHGGVGGAVVPEKQPKENGRFGVFQSNRYYNTQQNGRTQDTTSTKPHMIHDAYNTSIGPSSAVRSGTASPNAGLGITTDQPSPPFSPASFTLDPRHTTNFSITNGAPSPLPTGSTADGRFAADLRDSRGSAAAPAIELESKHQMFEADTVAGATSGGALSPPTPRTLNNRGSQFTTAGASSLRPSIRDMISPCSESPNLIQSRHPSQRSPPSAYQAYRNGGDQSVERGTSLTSATGYTGYKYMSPEDMMQHGWKNEPEPEPELRR